MDKVFVLENGNTDSSQRNIVYLVHGEKAVHVQAVAGMSFSESSLRGILGITKKIMQTQPTLHDQFCSLHQDLRSSTTSNIIMLLPISMGADVSEPANNGFSFRADQNSAEECPRRA